MKKIYQYMLMAAALLALASCSQSLVNSDSAGQSISVGGLQFVVGDFPVFGGGTQTRAIGTQDEGKTEWENGDKILVHLYSDEYGQQAVTLSFENGGWKSDGGTFDYLKDEMPEITAVYAPDCEIKEGQIALQDGKQYGEAEYILARTTISENSLDINFESGRTYSRLRIATMSNASLTVSTEGFTPAGATEVATAAYTLTTDNNGNAFLYGVFAEDATVSVKQGDITLKDYTFTAEKNPNGTEYNKSYALDATPVIDGTLGGKAEATEDDITALVELLKSYIENGLTTIIVTGSQPALILKDGYLIPVVSLAFEQLTYAYQDEKIDSYWRTVDLIYQDVTEIVEYEFYVCDVLKSITLPKVTTVGDRGFWACYYLETLTFGSVVTTINDNSGEVFYDLGYEIDGCNLVLNKDQGNVEGLAPDLANNTWAGYTWKSITLTHTGECDECKANQ